MNAASEPSHDTCALWVALPTLCTLSERLTDKKLNEDRCYNNNSSRARSLALVLALSRPLFHSLAYLPAYRTISCEHVSLKSSLAEFTSHPSRPARNAAVAQQTTNDRRTRARTRRSSWSWSKTQTTKKLHTKIKGEFTACLASHLSMFLCPVIFVLSRPSRVSLNWNRAARNLAKRIQFDILWNCCCICLSTRRKKKQA